MAKHPGGRPPRKYDPSEAKLVQALSQYRVPQEDIADELDMCVETLVKLYGKEYAKGRHKADTVIRKTLFEQAKSGNTAALLFYCKTQLGMRETNRLEMTSPDGSMSPMDVTVKFINSKLDD
jgi:hypothetical protein